MPGETTTPKPPDKCPSVIRFAETDFVCNLHAGHSGDHFIQPFLGIDKYSQECKVVVLWFPVSPTNEYQEKEQ